MDEVFNELFAMGTVITQRIYCDNAQKVLDECIEKIKEIEKLMSYFDTQSDVYRINKSAGIGPVSVDPQTLFVINEAIKYSKISKGTFDITLGSLTSLWRDSSKLKILPNIEKIKEARKIVNYKYIVVKNNGVFLKKVGQNIDLGAIAKGYTADKIIEIYKKHKVSSAFVNLGGNVYVYGRKTDNSFWKIGIQNPRGMTNDIIGYLEINDKTVVTSGDYQRFFLKDGIRYHHIIDPKTGYPSDSGIISVTTISDNSMQADAISTAIFVLGVSKGIRLAREFKDLDIIIISDNEKAYISKNIKNSFTLLNKSLNVSYI